MLRRRPSLKHFAFLYSSSSSNRFPKHVPQENKSVPVRAIEGTLRAP